jgi:hypothetical protein
MQVIYAYEQYRFTDNDKHQYAIVALPPEPSCPMPEVVVAVVTELGGDTVPKVVMGLENYTPHGLAMISSCVETLVHKYRPEEFDSRDWFAPELDMTRLAYRAEFNKPINAVGHMKYWSQILRSTHLGDYSSFVKADDYAGLLPASLQQLAADNRIWLPSPILIHVLGIDPLEYE